MNQDKTFTEQLDAAYAEATRPKPVPFYERKISLLVGKMADLEEENERLRKVEEVAINAWDCLVAERPDWHERAKGMLGAILGLEDPGPSGGREYLDTDGK